MAHRGHALGIDFGTSNSAAGYLRDGKPHLVEIAPGRKTIPTSVFFDFAAQSVLIGEDANQALLDGSEGRFMRALKRVLGTSLMHEKRQLVKQRLTFVDIIAFVLSRIKKRAEAETGVTFTRALSGRPVVFRGMDDPREAQAEDDLRACYLAAGFEDVTFMPEPAAAAIASGSLNANDQIGLVVDIGGGTSDFSLYRTSGTKIDILANHGVRIGGTDFDKTLSIDHVMPLLGRNTQLREAMGSGLTPVPPAIFNDLATWEKIPFLYTPTNRRMIDEMAWLAEEPIKLRRLSHVFKDELGHELAFAVEAGKIAANSDDEDPAIDLKLIDSGLTAQLTQQDLQDGLQTYRTALHDAAVETLRRANLPPNDVRQVVYVGGSSLVSMVPDAMKSIFTEAQHSFAEVFTAVADGLAIAAARTS